MNLFRFCVIAANVTPFQSSLYSQVEILVVLDLIFHFMILRQQQKRAKTYNKLMNLFQKEMKF